MKTGIVFSGFFWGVFLILLGAAVILKAVYHINVPVFRIFFGLLIVALGLRLLMGGFGGHGKKSDTLVFDEGVVEADEGRKEYNVIFGRGTIDLRGLVPRDKTIRIEINTVFGAATLRINPETPAQIRTNTAFGGVRLPDATNGAFGTFVHNTRSLNPNEPHLIINANVIFGGMAVVE